MSHLPPPIAPPATGGMNEKVPVVEEAPTKESAGPEKRVREYK
jgi:hypothetical protein